MEICDAKRQILYKNERGGRIMVRVTLPKAAADTELDTLYSVLMQRYFIAAKEFINKAEESCSYFFDVSYTLQKKEKYVKIKRLSTLSLGGKTLKSASLCDLFDKNGFKLKR